MLVDSLFQALDSLQRVRNCEPQFYLPTLPSLPYQRRSRAKKGTVRPARLECIFKVVSPEKHEARTITQVASNGNVGQLTGCSSGCRSFPVVFVQGHCAIVPQKTRTGPLHKLYIYGQGFASPPLPHPPHGSPPPVVWLGCCLGLVYGWSKTAPPFGGVAVV